MQSLFFAASHWTHFLHNSLYGLSLSLSISFSQNLRDCKGQFQNRCLITTCEPVLKCFDFWTYFLSIPSCFCRPQYQTTRNKPNTKVISRTVSNNTLGKAQTALRSCKQAVSRTISNTSSQEDIATCTLLCFCMLIKKKTKTHLFLIWIERIQVKSSHILWPNHYADSAC